MTLLSLLNTPPSGYLVGPGKFSGMVRVWDAVGPEMSFEFYLAPSTVLLGMGKASV